MRELNLVEMEDVSGAYSWNWGTAGGVVSSLVKNTAEAVASATNLAVTAGWEGAIIGGKHGGSNGGILGFGIIGNLVGVIGGGIYGTVGGAVQGALLGWDKASQKSDAILKSILDGNT
ncbi:hypothetical protein AAFN90_10185 [Erwiniaceae bacterium CAU 1747]